jgi:Zn-dependent protease with chaperone function
MQEQEPQPISHGERRLRVQRVTRIARDLGFVGRIEYRHVLSRAGGAQFGLGPTPSNDLLVVYADAFDRDVDPEDYSLEAIIGHERGHQMLCRDPRLGRLMMQLSQGTEEIVASLIGSLLVSDLRDRRTLVANAIGEAISRGPEATHAARLVGHVRSHLEELL